MWDEDAWDENAWDESAWEKLVGRVVTSVRAIAVALGIM